LKLRAGDVSFGNRFTVKFDYKAPTSYKNDRNFFRITNTDKKCCNINDQRLVINIWRGTNRLNIATSTKKNTGFNFDTRDFVTGQTYKIKIVFDDARIMLYRDYKPFLTKWQANKPTFKAGLLQPTKNADLYIGDKFLKPAGDGIFKKLRLFDAPMFLAGEMCGSDNNLGHLRRNVWFRPMRDYAPCGS